MLSGLLEHSTVIKEFLRHLVLAQNNCCTLVTSLTAWIWGTNGELFIRCEIHKLF